MTATPFARLRRSFEQWRFDGPDPSTFEPQVQGEKWAEELAAKANARAPMLQLLRDYHAGIQPIKFSTEAWRETYGDDFGLVTDNWCRIVVESKTERMNVLGFRFGQEPQANEDAWDHWQGNRMDVDSDAFHTDLLVTGWAYEMAWKTADGDIEWTVEDPMHTIVELDPANRRRRLAGFKRWRNRDDSWSCVVFTPAYWWRLDGSEDGTAGWKLSDWGKNSMGVVPIVAAVNSPDGYGNGTSDLEPILSLQDAVNKLLSDEMVVAEHSGFPQRVVLGLETPDEDDDDDIPPILGGKERWLSLEGENVKLETLETADLTVFAKSIEQKVQHMAALTRTPPHYLLGQIVNVSADALRAAEAGLVSTVRRRCRLAGEAHEETQRLMFLLAGDEQRARHLRAETIWANPETPSEAVLVDSLVKLKSLGLPDVMIWERLGLSPEEIKRAQALQEQQARLDGVRFAISGASGLPPDLADQPPEQ